MPKNKKKAIKESKQLKEGYLGQTLQDFLDVCIDEYIIDKIYVYGTDDIVYEGPMDDLPDDMRDAEFLEFEAYSNGRDMVTINVDSTEEYGLDTYYTTLEDFLDDCNNENIVIFDLGSEEEIFRGDKYDIPDEVRDLIFVSFDAPNELSVNLSDYEGDSDDEDEDDEEFDESLDDTQKLIDNAKKFAKENNKDVKVKGLVNSNECVIDTFPEDFNEMVELFNTKFDVYDKDDEFERFKIKAKSTNENLNEDYKVGDKVYIKVNWQKDGDKTFGEIKEITPDGKYILTNVGGTGTKTKSTPISKEEIIGLYDDNLKESTIPVKDLLVKTDNKYGITLDHAIDDIKKKKGNPHDSLLGDEGAISTLMKRFGLEKRDVIRALNYKFDGKVLDESIEDDMEKLPHVVMAFKDGGVHRLELEWRPSTRKAHSDYVDLSQAIKNKFGDADIKVKKQEWRDGNKETRYVLEVTLKDKVQEDISPLAKKMGAKFLPPKDYGVKKKRPRYVYEVYYFDTEDCRGDAIYRKFSSRKAQEEWYEKHKDDPDKFGMYAFDDATVYENLKETYNTEDRIKELKEIKKTRALTDDELEELAYCENEVSSREAEKNYLNGESLDKNLKESQSQEIASMMSNLKRKYGKDIEQYMKEFVDLPENSVEVWKNGYRILDTKDLQDYETPEQAYDREVTKYGFDIPFEKANFSLKRKDGRTYAHKSPVIDYSDILYTEDGWNKFANWVKETKGIDLETQDNEKEFWNEDLDEGKLNEAPDDLGFLTDEEIEEQERQEFEKKLAQRKAARDNAKKAEQDRIAQEQAKEKAKQDAIAKGKELYNKVKDLPFEDWFEYLVPSSGKASTVAGELVRAINRVIYRDWNDGDLFYQGYGRETCGAPAVYILYNVEDASSTLYDLVGKEDEAYTEGIEKVGEIIHKYLLDNPDLFGQENEDDCLDSKKFDVDVEFEEPRDYEYTIHLEDYVNDDLEICLADFVNNGDVDAFEVVDRIEEDANAECNTYDEIHCDTPWSYSATEYTINGLTKDQYDTLRNYMNSSNYFDSYIEELYKEYGDPNDPQRDEEVEESVNKNWDTIEFNYDKLPITRLNPDTLGREPMEINYTHKVSQDDVEDALFNILEDKGELDDLSFEAGVNYVMNNFDELVNKYEDELKELFRSGAITTAENGDLNEDLETFDDQMDFLAKDEEEAIDGYKKVIKKVDNDNVKTQLKKIETEEKAHKDYLTKVKQNKDIEYTEPLEEDTVKQGNKWVNKGNTGETHGEFKTKEEADKQRKAMFVNKKPNTKWGK